MPVEPTEIDDMMNKPEVKFEDKFRKARDHMSDWADDARHRSQTLWRATVDYTRERPGMALGIAVGAGAVLGALGAAMTSRPASVSSRWRNAARASSRSLRESLQDFITGVRDIVEEVKGTR